MCCPKKEVELPAKAKLPSKQRIADRLARVLKAAAVRLEEKRLEGRHPYQPRPSSYLAASDSRHDIDSYFNSLASNTPATRALPAKAANDDLSKFFASLDQGTLDGLAPKVSQELPQPQIIRIDSGLIQAAASQLANGLRAGIRQRASAERAAKFSGWQETSEGMRRSPRAPVMC